MRDGATGEVPAHLRDAHYQGAAALGHGDGYQYPHDHDTGWVAQQYLPDSLVGRRWYEPSTHGDERERGRTDERAHDMTAAELVVVLAAVLLSLGFAALIVVLLRVLDTVRDLRKEVTDLRGETRMLIDDLRISTDDARETVDEARQDLERFDRVLGSAEAIGDAVGSTVARERRSRHRRSRLPASHAAHLEPLRGCDGRGRHSRTSST